MEGIYHRPARTYPEAPPSTEVVIVAPPTLQTPAPGASSWLQYLVPVIGSAGSLVFVVFYHNLAMLILAGVTVVLSVGLGIAMRLQQHFGVKNKRKADRERYLKYLGERETTLQRVADMQQEVDARLYPDLQKLWTFVIRRQNLWERRRENDDFLAVRIGLGPKQLSSAVRLDLGSNPLVEYDPDLLSRAQDLVSRFATLPWAPMVQPLRQVGTLAVIGDRPTGRGVVRSLLCQLAAFQAPEDLRIMTYFPPEAADEWEWLKWLPHAREQRMSALADGELDLTCLMTDQLADFHSMLEAEIKPRVDHLRRLSERQDTTRTHVAPYHLLVVVDGFSPRASIARLPLLDELFNRGVDLEVTVVCLVDLPSDEPSRVRARIEVSDSGHLSFEETMPGGVRLRKLLADRAEVQLCDSIARAMAPLRLEEHSRRRELSENIRLLDLLRYPSADAVDPQHSWQRSDPDHLLQTPIGIRADGEPLILDLKEAAHGGMGPHGLIVGATGSGKSELLRTIVTGLAIRHDPETLSFVFVDFKGGAAFAELARLPHAAGLITNLQSDLTMVDRMRAALFGEQERRQRMLRQAGNLDSIREYHARRRQDPQLEPMPYVLIIVDEFGELLANRPDFLELFVALGRLGRSLGMHLLLATQRLDEGRIRGLEGHLRFRICLRTFSAAESSVVLGTPDAYYLPSFPGVGYFKVDTSLYQRFKTALISTPYRERHRAPNVPAAIRAFAPGPAAGAAPASREALVLPRLRTEMEAVVDRLREGAAIVHQVWLPPLEAAITLDQVASAGAGELRVPVGLIDVPAQQSQEPLMLDFAGSAGHLAVVGASQTGKSTLLRTILAAFIHTHSPKDVQFYCVDLGGGGLRAFEGAPHVGAVCGKLEPDKVRRLVREMRAVVDERELSFRELSIDSMAAYRRRRQRGELEASPYGDVFLVIDNWALLHQEFEGLDAEVAEIAANGLHYGVHVVLTSSRWADIRSSLRDHIGNRLELRLNDPADSEVSRAAAQSLPANIPGRGLTSGGLQFQVALPRLDGQPETTQLQQAIGELVERSGKASPGVAAPPIRMLPSLVERSALAEATAEAGVAFGLEEYRLEPVGLDLLGADPHFLVFGDAESGKTNVLRAVMHGLRSRYRAQELQFLVVDYRRTLIDAADGPDIFAYTCTAPMVQDALARLREIVVGRLPSSAMTREDLLKRNWWRGAHYVLIVDDYDLVLSPSGNPLSPLVELLPQGRDIGLHLVLARRVGGTARTSFEPVFQRVKELGTPGLILSGDPQEGPLLGTQRAALLPPGRGYLVRPHRRTCLVQTLYSPPSRLES